MRPPLSVLLTVLDEEEQLPLALVSVRGWADEIVVVVDPRTRDHSRQVATGAGARALDHPFEGSGAQCNWGLEQCSHDWVLVLDADERATAALRAGVDSGLDGASHAAFAVRRANFAFGRRLRFGDWGRDRIIRVLDRRRARFEERAVHGAVVADSVGLIGGEIEHHTLRSLGQYAAKLDDYAHRGSRDLRARGVGSGPLRAVAHGLWRFARAYVLRLGVLDGGAGLVVAALEGWGTFLKWALVWEETPSRRRP